MKKGWMRSMLDRDVVKMLAKTMGANGEDLEKKIDELFPDSAELNKPKDFIHLEMALDNPAWMLMYVANPDREIDVRMSYADLMNVYERMHRK